VETIALAPLKAVQLQPADATLDGSYAFQTLAAYQCYNPFPSVPASFYYTSGAQAWSRCGRATQAQTGSIGQIVPLLSHTGVYAELRRGVAAAEAPGLAAA